jgi:hypothetical protein
MLGTAMKLDAAAMYKHLDSSRYLSVLTALVSVAASPSFLDEYSCSAMQIVQAVNDTANVVGIIDGRYDEMTDGVHSCIGRGIALTS